MYCLPQVLPCNGCFVSPSHGIQSNSGSDRPTMIWAWITSTSVGGTRSTVISIFPSSASCSAYLCDKSVNNNNDRQQLHHRRDGARRDLGDPGYPRQPPSARALKLKKAADMINYHLRRNRHARKSHTKTRLAQLHSRGLNHKTLPSCAPNDPF